MSQWIDPIELEKIRTDEQAIYIQRYLKSKGYENISSFYPAAKFNSKNKLLARSANEIIELIEEQNACQNKKMLSLLERETS